MDGRRRASVLDPKLVGTSGPLAATGKARRGWRSRRYVDEIATRPGAASGPLVPTNFGSMTLASAPLSATSPPPPPAEPLSLGEVGRVWWPLAASWMLMGAELPILTAIVERLPDPEVNLAAYGSVVFPISLIVEAPIIMLLAAATALVRDRGSYDKLHRFMVVTSAVLTAIHILIAFTPLFDVVCGTLLGVPEELVEPARVGLRIMTPWTAAIAYRRMQQGVLIRAGSSKVVGVGTLVRLIAVVGAMLAAALLTDVSGIVVGSIGIACGVTAEAIFSGVLVQPAVRELPVRDGATPPLDWPRLFRFYAPLALTPLMTLVLPLVGSAAMARMRDPMISLAAWPAVHGLVFLFRGVGMAFNEVVVALYDRPGSVAALRRAGVIVAVGAVALLALLVATPLAGLWFEHAMNLSPELAAATRIGVALCLIMPAYQVAQSWFQGVLVAGGRTRAVPEAVALYALVAATLFGIGVEWNGVTGLYFAVIAFTSGGLTQTAWLWWRSRDAIRARVASELEPAR